MKMNKPLFLLLISLCLSPFATLVAQERLVILHTNDTHSRIEPLPPTDATAPGKGGVVRRASYIDQVRAAEDQVLLFDAGDFFQGTPYFNLFKGEVEIKAMNLMRYDAATLGNHEFDYGLEVLAKGIRMADFPIVSSNYDFSETPLAGMTKPYLILKKGKLRIGVIGINIQPKGLIAEANYKGLKFLDPEETANELAEKLRREHKCDMIVCLSHLGYQADLRLAESSRNIDLILGGHSHTYLPEPVERRNRDNRPVMIFQTNGRGVYVGKIDVTLKKGKREERVR
jgi:5'-nucleotidase